MGVIPFSESEYCLWEDDWILAAEKLQQWDVLYDLAKSEGNQELTLESAWRAKDWAENKEALGEQISPNQSNAMQYVSIEYVILGREYGHFRNYFPLIQPCTITCNVIDTNCVERPLCFSAG